MYSTPNTVKKRKKLHYKLLTIPTQTKIISVTTTSAI